MSKELAVSFVREIKSHGFEAPKLEISSLGGLNFVTAYTEIPITIMANDVSSGVDYNPDLAITKALVEHFERLVFAEGVDHGNPVCARTHSDGVAAFPASHPEAKLRARANAYSEALERYVWAKWWDDPSIGHRAQPIEMSAIWSNPSLKITIESFDEIIPIESISLIQPLFDQSGKHDVFIFFARVKGLGYISGGAAGPTNMQLATAVRGLAELIRHGIALSQFIERKQAARTFYEERLLYFGMGEGNKLVESRLQSEGTSSVELPSLEIDHEIISETKSSLVATHRCLFANQPPFVDGKMERLCL